MKNRELTRLRIWAFDSAKFNRTVGGEPFIVQANPNSFSISYALEYQGKQSKGSSRYNPKWIKNPARELKFECIFDGTHAIPDYKQNGNASNGEPRSVAAQISRFEATVFKMNGKKHEPNYLSIEWGALVFWCRLKSMNITYKLFEPDGAPLRASVNATFFEVIRAELRLKEENQESPDVTHALSVMEGDTLPQMAAKIYGDEAYYIAVAQAQQLIHFRNPQAGEIIQFPPIKRRHV